MPGSYKEQLTISDFENNQRVNKNTESTHRDKRVKIVVILGLGLNRQAHTQQRQQQQPEA